MISSITLPIRNEVTRKETNTLLTGIYAGLDGFRYDLKPVPSFNNLAGRYLESISSHSIGLKDGFRISDWVTGTISGIQFLRANLKKELDITRWVPEFSIGTFSVYWDERRLYSDYSYYDTCSLDEDYALSSLSLRDDCKQDTISCAIYRRQDDGNILAESKFQFVSEFTGELDGETRLATEGEGFIVENICNRFNEYTIRNDVLYLNKTAKVSIGIGEELQDILQTWEEVNPEAGGYVFLRYLNPVQLSVAVVIDNTLTILDEAELSILEESESGYQINSDLGVIKFSGETHSPVVLRESIDDTDTSIPCYLEENFQSLPDCGVVQINSEIIYYSRKGLSSLEDCTRAYRSTVAAAHTNRTMVHFLPQGTFLEGRYFVKYTAVPRVDYEVTTHEVRTANRTNWLDVQPLRNLKANKVIQILSQTSNLNSLRLTTDSQSLGGSLYGPVYFGTDVSRLTATALDASGNPVEDIEITIELVSGPGQLNHQDDPVTSESNSSGAAYAVFNAPYGEEDVLLDVTSVTYDGSDTLVEVESDAVGSMVRDVTLFQILKFDPSLGTVGKRVNSFDGGPAVSPNGLGYIDCHCQYTEDFNGGFLQVIINLVRYTFTINYAERITDTEPFTRFYLNEFDSALDDIEDSTTWLYQSDAEIWDPVLKRGAQVVLYEWSTDFEHPLTGDPGAYGPVWPASISGHTLRYANRLLPIPDPDDDEVNLGAYRVIMPREARFRATARDPYSGQLIISNEVRLKLLIPNQLSGVDFSGVLPIPRGFTFVTDDFNVGTGIGGANFLTVNPSASGINQFTLRG